MVVKLDDATTGFPPKIPFESIYGNCVNAVMWSYTEVRELPISGTDGTELCNDAIFGGTKV